MPTAITAADAKKQNEVCVPACIATAAMIRIISDPVDGKVLGDALGQAFIALNQTDWKSHLLLYRPLGLGVLLWSRFLQATADVSLFFAQQDWLWGGLQCESNLQRVFGSVLDKSMMRRYKRVVEEEGDTSGIDVNVEEGWELLVKKVPQGIVMRC